MSSPQCFVPNCENTSGVLFPKQDELRQKWLAALNVENAIPTESSFVCLDHFVDTDLVEGAQDDDDPTTKLKPDAIPILKIAAPCENSIQNEQNDEDQELHESVVSFEVEEAAAVKTDAPCEGSIQNEQNDEDLELHESVVDFEVEEAAAVKTAAPCEGSIQNEQNDEGLDLHESVVDFEVEEAIESKHEAAEEQQVESKLEATEEQQVESKHEASEEQQVESKHEATEEQQVESRHEATEEQQVESRHEATEEQQVEETIENIQKDVDSLGNSVCRLCTRTEGLEKDLNDILCDVVLVKTAILDCLHPLKVSEEDDLPQSVCNQCLDTLRICYEFRTACFETNKRLQKNKPTDNLKRKPEHEYDSPSKKSRLEPNSVCNQEDQQENDSIKKEKDHSNKQSTIKCESISEDFVDWSPSNDSHIFEEVTDVSDLNLADTAISEAEVIEELQDGSSSSVNMAPVAGSSKSSTFNILSTPPPLVPIKSPQAEVITGITLPKQIKISHIKSRDRYKGVEEQLRRVLEGSLSDDMMAAENIIIEVQSDEEDSNEHNQPMRIIRTVQKPVKKPVKRLKLPLTIKHENKPSSSPENIVLPRGIRVSKFQSEVGTFPSSVVKGLYDTEFCQADGYLFEYRLCKGRVRYLKCIVSTCPAVGHQNLLPSGVYDKRVSVKTSHNHEVPSRMEMKKQMFFYVMKKKMQNDRTLNFRTVYETVCRIDPEIKTLVPLRYVINEICRHQLTYKLPVIRTFDEFFSLIEEDVFQKLHFTHNGKQFYQEKFTVDDGSKAIVFANQETVRIMSDSKIMYVDSSFKIETQESFRYQLVTVLVWVEDSYYPIMYALVSKRSQEIFRRIFQYLHDTLAPNLQPDEIVTDYEANLYYALGETYVGSHIGGSCFYYTQNLYKKICSLNLSRELETSSYFRNIYHMLLMLPLLPVNTILDGLTNIEAQAREIGLSALTKPLFEHVRSQWIMKVTPELFCVHRLENRINENVIAPFKKLRDFLMLTKGKIQRQPSTVITVVEKIIELEGFLRVTYANKNKKSFARDLSSSQKKNVIRAWMYIENHPKININNFFTKVLGYIRCMENQLWIWGFYRYGGDTEDDLINAVNFSIVNSNEPEVEAVVEGEELMVEGFECEDDTQYVYTTMVDENQDSSEGNTVVMEGMIGEDGEFVLTDQSRAAVELDDADQIDIVEEAVVDESSQEQVLQLPEGSTHYENAYLKYVYRE